MSVKELKRVTVIKNVSEGLLKQIEAGELLELSERQIRRLSIRVKEEGERGIIHRLRGQPSNRKKPEVFKKKILELCETTYSGFNPTFASEKLLEEEKLEIHPETLRLWFIGSEIEYERRKGRKRAEAEEAAPRQQRRSGVFRAQFVEEESEAVSDRLQDDFYLAYEAGDYQTALERLLAQGDDSISPQGLYYRGICRWRLGHLGVRVE